MWVIIIVSLCIIIISLLFKFFNFKSIVNVIANYNVCIGGLVGTGKDTLEGNSIAYNNHINSYIANIDYGIKNKTFIPLEVSKLDIKNNFDNFINGNIIPYKFPYEDNIPVHISDASIYFPSAYENELKKKYKGVVNYMPLSRHLGGRYARVVFNSQNVSQVWDKLRNQSDQYILCMSCRWLFNKFVFARVRIYEKYDSFIARIPPLKLPNQFLMKRSDRNNLAMLKIKYNASYGSIKRKNLFFVNKTKYNSRFMKNVLEGTYFPLYIKGCVLEDTKIVDLDDFSVVTQNVKSNDTK